MQSDLEHDMTKVSPYSPKMVKQEVLGADGQYFPWYVEPPTESTISRLYLFSRTALNLTFALCAVLILLLILPILALLIYLDSPGPIFYSQERIGYRGRKFCMYKFRSMRPDAEQTDSPKWSNKGDSRVTRVGRLMRTTHLDELPQAFNILRGEMSLIGPRPEREKYAAELEKINPLYRYRLAVKPGLTGWSQVSYGYGSTSEDELVKLQYDLYYIEHQSFTFDVRIILKTIVEVVLCHGT
jgi:lipopolysaccharide/colanic/teichoic acid biosynthesis glycosyltransferase